MAKYSNKQLLEMVESSDFRDREKAARLGAGLDVLINDRFWFVRRAVAEQGYGLDMLKNDQNPDVRAAVAAQGHYLEELSKDEDACVREAVLQQGYHVEEFSEDEHWKLRFLVSKQGMEVNYLDKDTGAYLPSLLGAEVQELLWAVGYEGSDSWVRNLPNEIKTVGKCLEFAKNADFSSLKRFGETGFKKLLSVLSNFDIDCSAFRFRGKTIEGQYALLGVDSSAVRRDYEAMCALGFDIDGTMDALKKKYNCRVNVIRDTLRLEGVDVGAEQRSTTPCSTLDKEVYLQDSNLCSLDLSEVGLAVAPYSRLRYANICTVGDLLSYPEDKLKTIYGLGEKRVEAIMQKVEAFCVAYQEKEESRGDGVVADILADAEKRSAETLSGDDGNWGRDEKDRVI